MSRERLRWPRGNLTARQKSAEGVVDHVVGKAIEALQHRKVEQQIGRAGNGGRRPKREGEASRHGSQERHAAEEHPDNSGLPV